MNKKLLIILGIALALAAAAVCWYLFLRPDTSEDSNLRGQMNTIATNLALQENKISKNEILLMESSKTEENGNLTVTFRVYSVGEGYSASYFIGMTTQEAKRNPGLTDMGYATASFLKGQPEGIFGLKVFHER